MDSTNAFEIISGPGFVECAPNLRMDEDSAKVQASEVSNTLNNAENSNEKSTKTPTNDGKMSVKRKNVTEERPLKMKKTNPLPTSYMVMESIKALKKRNGASVNAILEYMEGEYNVNAKLVKRYVTRYLTSAVEKGIVEKLSGAGNEERFKIKKVEKINKVGQKLKADQKMVKGGKVAKVGSKANDNKKKIKAEKVAKVGQKSNDNKKIKAAKVAKVGQKQNQKKAKGEKVAKAK